MTVSDIGGGDPIGAKEVASMELTIGSKTIPTSFFIFEVQGNFNLILGRDWIHANQCVPSSLLQFLIQWIGDEFEVVHSDASSFIATTDFEVVGTHHNIKCLSGLNLTDCDLISCTKEGFVSAVLKRMENRLHLLLWCVRAATQNRPVRPLTLTGQTGRPAKQVHQTDQTGPTQNGCSSALGTIGEDERYVWGHWRLQWLW